MNGCAAGISGPVVTIWHPAAQDTHPASPAGRLTVPGHRTDRLS